MYNIKDITNKIICGDTLTELKKFPDDCIDTIITSPPYWGLRDYGVEGQIGLEKTLDEYLKKLLQITNELKRVLKKTGVMFWNHGDCYSSQHTGGNHSSKSCTAVGTKKAQSHRQPNGKKQWQEKCLVLQNFRLILKMIDQGWILRNTIIWHKPNHMPSSVKDRFSNSYEPVFMLVKNKRYWFDLDAVRISHTESGKQRAKYKLSDYKGSSGKSSWCQTKDNPLRKKIDLNPAGKNPGDVWRIPTASFPFDYCPKCEAIVTSKDLDEGMIHRICGTEAIGHFATFPQKLVEPMIKSCCPKEICKKCGEAREKIMKTTSPVETGTRNVGGRKDGYTTKLKKKWWADKEFLGWTDCRCNTGWKKGIVLDPFMGSGTVAIIARYLGRSYTGIELNKDYCKITDKRLSQQSLGL